MEPRAVGFSTGGQLIESSQSRGEREGGSLREGGTKEIKEYDTFEDIENGNQKR